jgi:hypothetical protein
MPLPDDYDYGRLGEQGEGGGGGDASLLEGGSECVVCKSHTQTSLPVDAKRTERGTPKI